MCIHSRERDREKNEKYCQKIVEHIKTPVHLPLIISNKCYGFINAHQVKISHQSSTVQLQCHRKHLTTAKKINVTRISVSGQANRALHRPFQRTDHSFNHFYSTVTGRLADLIAACDSLLTTKRNYFQLHAIFLLCHNH